MKTKFLSIIVVCILVLAGFVMVWNFGTENVKVRAAALYVGGDGPGNWTVIQYAIDNATDGDTIYVYNGTYFENVIVNKSVTIIGNGTDNCTIDGGGNGDVIYVNVDWVNITGIKVNNSGNIFGNLDAGIKLDKVNFCEIDNCNVTDNLFGIYLNITTYCTIENSEVNYNWREGIYVDASTDCTLYNNTASFNNQNTPTQISHSGVRLYNSDYNTLEDNYVDNNPYYGVRLTSSHNNTIILNDIVFNCGDEAGIFLESSNYNHILNNNISNNTQVGIYINYAHHNEILNNTLTGNDGAGMQIWGSDWTKVINNTVIDSAWDGIYMDNCDYTEIIDNDVNNSNTYGIYLEGDHGNISNNNVSGSGSHGIYLYQSTDCDMIDNKVYFSDETGIYIQNCNYTDLITNNVTDNNKGATPWDYAGIYIVDNSFKISLFDNNITNNSYYGLRIENSVNNSATYNEIVYNCGGESGLYLDNAHYNTIENNNITNNTGNGVYLYYANHNDFLNNTIDGNNLMSVGYGGFLFYESDNNTLFNNTMNFNTDEGVYIYYNSEWNKLIDNDIIGNTNDGIDIIESDHNEIINNNVSGNDNYGLYLELGENNIVNSNDFYWNTNSGINVYQSEWNDIKLNNVSWNNQGTSPWNDAGLYSIQSHNNTYELNNVTNNPYYGLRLEQSNDNLVLFNQIVNNCGDDSGIYILTSHSNEFINNNVSNNTGNGIFLEYSDYNDFLNNTINGNNEFTVGNGGIYTYDSHNNWWDNNSINNNGGAGIYLSISDGNLFTNCTIIDSTVEDARASNSDFTLLNCTFDKSKLTVTGSGTITVQYYHTLFTYDWATVEEDAGGVGFATLWINNSGDPTHIYDRLTNADGYIYWVNLTAYIYDGSFNYSMQDMEFHATKTGYSEGINITNSSAQNFLIKIYMVDPFPAIVYDVTADPTENITKTNPTNVQAKIEEDNLFMAGMILSLKAGELGNDEFFDTVGFIFDNDPRITLTPGPGNLTYFNGTFDGTNPGGWADDGVNRTWVPIRFTPDPNFMGFQCWYTNDSNPSGAPGFAMFHAGNGTFAGIHLDSGEDVWPNQVGVNDIVEYQTMRWFFDKQTGILTNMIPDVTIAGFNPLNTQIEWQNKTPSGPYKALVFANDRSDNGNGGAVSISVDNMGPDNIMLSTAPLYDVNITKGMVTFEVTTTSTDTKNVTFYKSSDGVNWNFLYFDNVSGDGWKYTYNSTLTADEEFYIKVVMNDVWGNMNESDPMFVKIDNTRPDIWFIDPSEPDLVVGGDVDLEVDTTANDVEWCLFEYKPEAGGWSTLTTDTNGTDGWALVMNSSLYSDGNYTIRATFGDYANNTNTTTITLVIDNTPPDITLVTPTTGLYFSDDFTVVVEIDELHMDRVEFWGSEDNITWDLYDTDDDGSDGWSLEVNFSGTNAPDQGHYWLQIVAYDTVGNNVTVDWEAYIDLYDPEVTIYYPNDADWLAGTVTINANATDNFSALDNVKILYDNGVDLTEIYNATPSTDIFETDWDTTLHSDGAATLTLMAADISGRSSSASITVTIDNTDPLADAGDDATIDAGTDFVFDGTGSSDNLGLLTYEWTFVYDGTDQSLSGVNPSFTFDIAGEYEVTLTVTDQADNTATDTIMVNVTVTIELPTVVDTDPVHNSTQVPVTTTVTITFSLPMNTSSVEDALVISPTVGSTFNWNQDNTTLTITFTADLTDNTTYTITIGVDAEGIAGGLLQDTPYAFEFTTAPIPPPPPNTKPVLTQGAISPTSGDTDTLFTFSVTYTDADNDPGTVSVWIDGVEEHMTPDPDDTDYTDGVEYTYEAKLSEGLHSYYFTADDGTDDAEAGDTTPTTTADADDTPSISKVKDKEAEDEDWMMYLILIIVVVIIIVILLVAMSRRKPTEEELLAAEEEELAAEEEMDDMDLVAGEASEDEGLGDEEEDEAEDEDEGGFECPTCGASLAEGDTVCPECGEEFEED